MRVESLRGIYNYNLLSGSQVYLLSGRNDYICQKSRCKPFWQKCKKQIHTRHYSKDENKSELLYTHMCV